MRRNLLLHAATTIATTCVVGGTAYGLLLGCAEGTPSVIPTARTEAEQTAEVGLAYGGGYGKAVFVVYPQVNPGVMAGKDECYIVVPGADGPRNVDCNSQYIVACDIDVPKDRPFCAIVSEIGSDRESAYPKHKRQ
jgi:hypothetical protein